jgi:2-polyprenyl-3-methyl-5-hydroxy-6-metoxy-1,4-benzoquinol methylase
MLQICHSMVSKSVTKPQHMSPTAPHDHQSACVEVPSRFRGLWLKGYVRGKLRMDPMYGVVFERLRGSGLPILDLGCGVGILPYYLCYRGLRTKITGVDWDAGRIAIAQKASRSCYPNLTFIHQDVRTPIRFQGHVVMLDLLHYLDEDDQRRLLDRVATRIAPGGIAVIRQCPRDSSNRFKLTNVQERLAHALRWHKGSTIKFPARETIVQPFRARGFSEEILPMWGGTPFNNYLFVFCHPTNNVSSGETMNNGVWI